MHQDGRSNARRAFDALFPPLLSTTNTTTPATSSGHHSSSSSSSGGARGGDIDRGNAANSSTSTHPHKDTNTSGVDISVDDILLPPLERAVDAEIYSALQRWNELEPVRVESALTYAERVKKYQAIVRWVLYKNHELDNDSDSDDNEDDTTGVDSAIDNRQDAAAAARRTADSTGTSEYQSPQTLVSSLTTDNDDDTTSNTTTNSESMTRAQLIAQRKRAVAMRHARRLKRLDRARLRRLLRPLERRVFHAMPAIEALRAARKPSARVTAFVDTFASKTRDVQQKRSVSDTRTALNFAFARPAPPLFASFRAVNSEGDEEDEQVGEEATGASRKDALSHAATLNTRTSNLLLARGGSSNDENAQTTLSDDANAASEETNVTDELVLWLDVLHPSKDPAKTQSFIVRESTTLADVADLVVCATDQRFEAHARHSKLMYWNATFYVDRRSADHVDYATSIVEWIHASPSRQARYLPNNQSETHAMEHTTFREVALTVDVPGVYIHQGECEHLLRLRDVRLPHAFDAVGLNREQSAATGPTSTHEDGSTATASVFPLRLPNEHFRALRHCFICQQYSAKYICYGDRLGVADPMLFCDRCYRAAHFDPHGALIYDDFQSFPYIQD